MKRVFLFFVSCFSFFNMCCNADIEVASVSSVLPKQFRVVFEQNKNNADIEWVLSSIKKINGQWRYEKSDSMNGNLLQQTYEFDQASRLELAKSIEQLVINNSWETVFECKGLSCGRSYGWSEILSNKMLHGIDDTQSYWVWKNANRWFSAFLIERGNRRIYLQWLELTINKQQQSENQNSYINQDGKMPYAVVVASNDVKIISVGTSAYNELKAVADWLKEQKYQSVAIVGHNQVEGLTFSQQQSQSLSHAEVILSFLQKELPAVNFKVFGLGPLAPRNAFENRVEILPINN